MTFHKSTRAILEKFKRGQQPHNTKRLVFVDEILSLNEAVEALNQLHQADLEAVRTTVAEELNVIIHKKFAKYGDGKPVYVHGEVVIRFAVLEEYIKELKKGTNHAS